MNVYTLIVQYSTLIKKLAVSSTFKINIIDDTIGDR